MVWNETGPKLIDPTAKKEGEEGEEENPDEQDQPSKEE